MGIRFDVQVRAFEDGKHSFDQQVSFQLNDLAEPIAASQRMVEEFARGYHGLKDPTPADINNVMCNELFHLLGRQGAADERRALFVSGSLLRLCAMPEQAQAFSGLGRHPLLPRRRPEPATVRGPEPAARGQGRGGRQALAELGSQVFSRRRIRSRRS